MTEQTNAPTSRDTSTQQKCGHFALTTYGCESCFMSHEEIALEKLRIALHGASTQNR
jgi:hypothetical protein